MGWKCPFCGNQLVLSNFECPKCRKYPWEYASISCDAGTDDNRPIHYPLFYARGNANDDPGMISISNATPLRGDNQHFIRGDNILGTFMSEEPPQTPRNRAAVDALIKELERQGYVHDPYNPHGHEWYMYKFRRIGTGK